MKKKILALTSVLALAGLTLASCGGTERNTTTPTGSLDLNASVATAENGKYTLSNGMYYNRLRYSASSLVTNKIKAALYKNELAAITELFKSNSATDLSEATKNLLIPTKDNTKLFELTGTELLSKNYEALGATNNYDVLKINLMNTVNGALSTTIFSTQQSDSIKRKTEAELKKFIKQYIVSSERKGITLTKDDLAYTYASSENNFNIISFTNIKSDALSEIVYPTLLTEAEKLSAQNALYQIADKEYIKAYDADEDDEETKNSNYLYKQSTIESTYESSYQTFGTYHAIIIQFNSRKEAMDALDNLGIDFHNLADTEAAKAAYVNLYNTYYQYKTITSADDEKFTYTINEVKDDFSDVSSGVKDLIQNTLEDNQYLKEPRNINNKYVMAIRLDTTYDVSGTNEEKEYSELTDAQKEYYNKKIKYNSLLASASNYVTTNFKSMVYARSNDTDTTNDIFIYDPLQEYRFYNSYSTDYVLIDAKNFDNNYILAIDDYKYSVEDFYKDATKEYASTVVTNYFELEYAYQYYDEFIDTDTHDTNVETVDTALSDFNSNKNTSYPKEVGLETYLLSAYGYTSKDDIIKYYFDATSCLSKYTEKKIFTDWAVKSEDGTYTYAADLETKGILYNLLNEGNSKYSELFSINLDHFLINIDDDGDGNPDDPDEFIKDMTDEEKTKFQNAVVKLARALYTEALNDAYKDNSLYKVLSHIKTQYEQGGTLKSTGESWDDYKEYNFLLTVEQLASSGDITQSSVSSFVTPFADYVKGVYKTCVDNNVDKSFSNGKFYYYNTVTKEGNVMDSADNITVDTLCKTVYGYHVLILNSYSEAKKTSYTESDDSSGVQAKIQLLIKEDTDNSDNNIYVTVNSYNTEETKVSFNQFFIYYIQKANNVESSLSSNISSLLSSMYDDLITTYTSSNFQKVLLHTTLNIDSTNETIKKIAQNEIVYYKNLVCNYADSADVQNDGNIYYNWVFGNMDWTRPSK